MTAATIRFETQAGVQVRGRRIRVGDGDDETIDPEPHHQSVDFGAMSHHETPLPKTREALMALHRETRRVRNAAAHGSEAHKDAVDLIGRIEVEVARIERAMDPPLV
jgi:hypothetical protein